MLTPEPFDTTSGELARVAGINQDTVRLYANLNLIESRRLSNGTRVFQRSAAALARRLREERLTYRGRRTS
jgi:DNA-binding transcriptional MerR regulator